ncbi:conserved hypothetical protein [Planktothrix agardhii]|nr:conserved hypothetical protein [Planktothrix agardhii]
MVLPLAISFYDKMEVLYTQAISTKGEARWLECIMMPMPI